MRKAARATRATPRPTSDVPRTAKDLERKDDAPTLVPIFGTSVSSRMGELDFSAGYPSAKTTHRLHDELDFQRAVQAYLWAIPYVGFGQWQDQHEQVFGAHDGELVEYRSFRDKLGLLTANATTPYLIAFANLGRTGPLVIDVPEGPTAGGVLDFWQRPASDLGLTGPDRGAGGRYVAVGPGQTPPSIPNARTIATATLNIFVATRILATDSTEAARLKDGFSLYPAARADHPSRRRIVHPDGRAWSGAHPRGLAYWELVARLVNQEPVHERDRILVAMLEHVGIVKGRSFAPDGRQRRILEEAALVGEAMARAMSHERRFEGATMYPGTAWTNALLFEPDQEGEHTTKLDERTAWFYEAVTATKGMTTKTPGEGQAYLHVSRDRSGAWLVGDHAYELTIPANVPVEQFWSFTVYDTDTRCFIDTPHERADRSSRDPLDVNDDGSVTLHIGPVPPASGDANWIPTVPDAAGSATSGSTRQRRRTSTGRGSCRTSGASAVARRESRSAMTAAARTRSSTTSMSTRTRSRSG